MGPGNPFGRLVDSGSDGACPQVPKALARPGTVGVTTFSDLLVLLAAHLVGALLALQFLLITLILRVQVLLPARILLALLALLLVLLVLLVLGFFHLK